MKETFMDLTSIAATTIASAAGESEKKIIDDFFAYLAKNSTKFLKKGSENLSVFFEIGFRDFLISSYNKCKNFKTILNTNISLDTYTQYIHATLSDGLNEIDDHVVIENIDCENPIVITGSAGCGKSMLLKYITVSLFKNRGTQIPLFTDLRKINPITEKNLLTFIRTSCSTAENSISDSQFNKALEKGLFVFILDGFDELNSDIRDKIQDDILMIRIKYPKNSLILSSRPDDRFGSWADFTVYTVKKLKKEKCLELISQLPYDSGVKRRFYDKVKNELYEIYEDFLVYPLLVSIMLLTFEECAHIPNKITEFYNQAFDTLFYKHDALKEQYKRKFYTDLTKDEFKMCFSSFCVMGYTKEQYSFNETSIRNLSDRSIKYTSNVAKEINEKCTAENFVKDLTESICLVQKDGYEYSFVHRSFQEYFAALFISKTNTENKIKLLNNFSNRLLDSVIPMAFELDKENIERDWVLPTLKICNSTLDNSLKSNDLTEIIEGMQIIIDQRENKILCHTIYNEKNIGRLDVINNLYTKATNAQNRKFSIIYTRTTNLNISDLVIDKKNQSSISKKILSLKTNTKTKKITYTGFDVKAKDQKSLNEILLFTKETKIYEQLKNRISQSELIINDISRRINEKREIDDDIFG